MKRERKESGLDRKKDKREQRQKEVDRKRDLYQDTWDQNTEHVTIPQG